MPASRTPLDNMVLTGGIHRTVWGNRSVQLPGRPRRDITVPPGAEDCLSAGGGGGVGSDGGQNGFVADSEVILAEEKIIIA